MPMSRKDDAFLKARPVRWMGDRKLRTLAFSKIESRKGEARRGNFRDGRKIMMIFIPNEISPAAPERAGIDIVP